MKPGKNGPDGREKYQDAYIKQNSYNCRLYVNSWGGIS